MVGLPQVESRKLDSPGGPLYVTGPSDYEGPMPAFFYFALAGNESLELDPFNQPAAFLQGKGIRVYSMTLPAHGPGFDKTKAIYLLAGEVAKGNNPFKDFLDNVRQAIDWLEPLLIEGKIATGGLSRGAFAATHLAAVEPRLSHILGFAPMCSPSFHSPFAKLLDHPITQILELDSLVNQLVDRRLRFYIGNRDMRVSTECCFRFVRKLVDAAFESGIRSPPIDLIIGPSAGHMGHGTLPPVFQDGVQWLERELIDE